MWLFNSALHRRLALSFVPSDVNLSLSNLTIVSRMKWVIVSLPAVLLAATAAPDAVGWEQYSALLDSITEQIDERDGEEKYTVNLENDEVDVTPLGELTKVSDLAVTMDSVVRIVADSSGREYVAKYASDCRGKFLGGSSDSARDEYAIQALLNGTGIAPDVYFLSSPTPVLAGFADKAKCGLLENSPELCYSVDANVRLMVMQRAGPCVESYLEWLRGQRPDDSDYFRTVLKIALKSIALLEAAHARGVLHGDVHGRNVVFKAAKVFEEIDLDTDDLVLIDFGMASFFVDDLGTSQFEAVCMGVTPILMTPWQHAGLRYGRRDDIYRLLDFIAMALSDGKVDAAMNSMFDDAMQKLQAAGMIPDNRAVEMHVCNIYRSSFSFFTPNELFTTGCCAAMGLEPEAVRAVQGRLEAVMEHTKSMEHVDEEPDYEFLKESLTHILRSTR